MWLSRTQQTRAANDAYDFRAQRAASHRRAKVELGIAEGSLLGSAMLVYLSPLVGLFVLAGIFQVLFGTDLAAMCGGALGGVGGFMLARGFSQKLAEREAWQPVILSVGLPPNMLRVETLSSEAR